MRSAFHPFTVLLFGLLLPAGAAMASDGGFTPQNSPAAYWSRYDTPAPTVQSIPPSRGTVVYGWSQDEEVSVRPRRRVIIIDRGAGGCGTYRYWDGVGCADARDRKRY
jgi:hypothetical protein